MVYRKIDVTIRGVTPLLMNRMNPETLKAKTRKKIGQTADYDAEARNTAYIDKINGKEQLYIPGEAVFRALINASGIYRTKKMSIRSVLAGSMIIEPEKIPLGTNKFETDVRPVVIQRSRVLKARAKIPNWQATFQIVYDDTIIPDQVIETLETILRDAGRRFGLLDYRPQNGGQFGVFEVVNFNPVVEKTKKK